MTLACPGATPGHHHVLPRSGDGGFVPRAGRGRAPSPAPTPQGDSHHGPLPGASRGKIHPTGVGTSTWTRTGGQQNLIIRNRCTSGPFHLILVVPVRGGLPSHAKPRRTRRVPIGRSDTDFASSRLRALRVR
ncbi:hypothetical protein BN140_3062 [Methanoculleus bourgensis MS2]|uniref:Uncharacterized protein n=1 Tax=Methanoculleus bourgensis (strain ATCC 43281 / DSM 3045 / OCM 15 / MS2) TaxID=1201294 RepID=W6PR01_METBM|nr:hypothetical protein BN140_3062 [Methanoculleus bourgensis MS2]